MSLNNKYTFWLTNPKVLYDDQKYLEFIPTSGMTRVEQLNSLTRFCIYFLVLALVTKKSDAWVQVPIITIIFCVILYYVFDYDKEGMYIELSRTKGFNTDDTHDDDTNNGVTIETGGYDSKGKLNLGQYRSSKTKKYKNIKYSVDDYNDFKKATCRMPTKDNPFMNPILNDFEMEMPPEPCNADDDLIKEKIGDAFNEDLFMDVTDLFERQNSQRQYYTLPQMNPPDQTGFAKWLYGTDNICKVDQSKCLRYEDIRFKR
jgi:hypothetical protein